MPTTLHAAGMQYYLLRRVSSVATQLRKCATWNAHALLITPTHRNVTNQLLRNETTYNDDVIFAYFKIFDRLI